MQTFLAENVAGIWEGLLCVKSFHRANLSSNTSHGEFVILSERNDLKSCFFTGCSLQRT